MAKGAPVLNLTESAASIAAIQKLEKRMMEMVKHVAQTGQKLDLNNSKKLRVDAISQQRKIQALEIRLQSQKLQAGEKAEIRNSMRAHKRELRRVNELIAAEVKGQEKVAAKFKKEMGDFDIKDVLDIKDWVGGFVGSLEAGLKSMDVKGLADKLSEGIAPISKTLSFLSKKALGKSQEAGGDTKKGKAYAGISSLLEGGTKILAMAKVLLGVTAAAGSLLAMLVSLANAAKEMNKEILDGAGALDVMSMGAGRLGDNLTVLRRSLNDLQFQTGTSSKELSSLMSTMNQNGVTIRQITGDMSKFSSREDQIKAATEGMAQSMRPTIALAKAMGMGMGELAQQEIDHMHELQIGMEAIQDQYAEINTIALESGFGVKRFYSMVLQATSGMSGYNVRLDETAGLLVRIGKILGQKQGADFVGNLNKRFAGMGTTDRIKTMMTTGSGTLKKIFAVDADMAATTFNKNFAKTIKGSDEVKNILSQYGVNADASGNISSGALSGLSIRQQTDMVGQLTGVNSDLANNIRQLTDVSRASRGGMGAMTTGMSQLGQGSTLVAQLNSANAILGQPLHEMEGITRAAFESITGVSGENLEQMRNISMALTGQFNAVSNSRGGVASRSGRDREDFQAKLVERFGAYVDEQGRMFSASTRRGDDGRVTIDPSSVHELTGGRNDQMREYMQRVGQTFSASLGDPMSQQEFLLSEVATNTQTLSDIMEQRVASWLEKIYGLLQPIYGFIERSMGGNSVERSGIRQQALDEVQRNQEMAMSQVTGMRSQAAGLRSTVKTGKTPAERMAAESQLRALESQIAQKTKEIQKGSELYRRVASDQGNLMGPVSNGTEDRVDREGNAVSVAKRREATWTEKREDLIRRNMAAVGMSPSPAGASAAPAPPPSREQVKVETQTAAVTTAAATNSAMEVAAAATNSAMEVQAAATNSAMEVEAAADAAAATQETLTRGLIKSGQEHKKLHSSTGPGDALARSKLPDAIAEAQLKLQFKSMAASMGMDSNQIEEATSLYMQTGRVSDALATRFNDPANAGAPGAGGTFGRSYRSNLMALGIPVGPTGEVMGQSGLRFGQAGATDGDDPKEDGPVEDFIYRGGSSPRITPIHHQDSFVGMRPGGPVDRASGGGGATVNITIHGNEERAFSVVKRALVAAGVGPRRSG